MPTVMSGGGHVLHMEGQWWYCHYPNTVCGERASRLASEAEQALLRMCLRCLRIAAVRPEIVRKDP